MFQRYEVAIGLRYLRAKRSTRFVSFISMISMFGIALGITALITVLSVMNGFQTEVRKSFLGVTSHATVSELDGELSQWQPVVDNSLQLPEVVGAAPYVEKQIMVVKGGEVTGALVRAIDPSKEPSVSDIGDKILGDGRLDQLEAKAFNIIIGDSLARNLGVNVGDKITIITPEASVTAVGVLPRMKRFTVAGIFDIGMFQYDSSLVFMHIDDARLLFRMNDKVTGVRLKLADMFKAREVSYSLRQDLGHDFWVVDWTQMNASYWQAVKTEKTIMFVILTLIIAVAAFNIVSTLVMVVNEKQADIAILRTLGASPRSIMLIFLVQGAAIGCIGTLLGLVGGITLAINVPELVSWLEGLFQAKIFDPTVYPISEIPSDLQWNDVFRVTGMAFVISLIVTLYPSWNASKTQPAEALRYE